MDLIKMELLSCPKQFFFSESFLIFYFSLQMCNVPVTLIFGYMMMVAMRKKVKIIFGVTFGKRQPKEVDLGLSYSVSTCWFLNIYICLLYRHLHGLSAPCSRSPYLLVSPMDRGMNLAIILLLQIIQSKKGFRSYFYLDLKVPEQALFSSRYCRIGFV